MKLPAFLASRSKSEKISLSVLGVLLLGVLGMQLLGGDDEPLDIPTLPPTTRTPTAMPTMSPIPVTDGAFGRDPFIPLVVEFDGGGGATPPTDAPSPGPSGGTTGGTASKRVTLVDIFGSGSARQATVSVDGTEFTVKEGETFDTSFRLLSLTSRCGTFVFGDERFTLCIGQEVRK